MEKVIIPIEVNFDPILLFKEDIEKIISFLHTEGFKEIILDDGENKYRADEIEQIGDEEVEILKISSTEVFEYNLTVKLLPFPSFFLYQKNSTLAEGVKVFFENFFSKRRRPLHKFLSILIPSLLNLSIVLVFFVSLHGLYNKELNIFFGGVVLIFSLVIIAKSGFPKVRSKIFLDSKANHPSFWTKKKDEIFTTLLIRLIEFLLFGTIGFLLRYLTE